MHVHECGLAGDTRIAVGHGNNDALVQAIDQLYSRGIDEGVEEAGLSRSGIGEQILDAGCLELLDPQLAAVASECTIGARITNAWQFRRFQFVDYSLCSSHGESGRRHTLDKSASGESIVEQLSNQFTHNITPCRCRRITLPS
ncbi:MAG: hypothetical protein IH912_02110 [Proteobacteria bacterium]|nr:hypothetical protein [Pseudomonadota bacterium]